MNDEDSKAALVEAPRPSVSQMEAPDQTPKLGEWFWVRGLKDWNKKEILPWLGCVNEVGTNYVNVRGVAKDEYNNGNSWRIHLDDVLDHLTPAPEAPEVIAREVAEHQAEVRRLMGEVKLLTSRLAVTSVALPPAASEETSVLALRNPGDSMADYKTALVKAKKETLPELFKQIEEANKAAARWMSAPLIPLRAEAAQLTPAIKAVEQRIFNVELYAGLVEQVVQIMDGEPAPVATPIHLFQRRHYMDEEALLNYRHGGMEFKDLGAFDRWLAEPENRDRILPKPRCIVAFQVRRNEKEREMVNLSDFIRILEEHKLDKLTFLYLRNGDRVYRLSTEIDFGADLFPDLDRIDTTGKLYMNTRFGGHRDMDLITEGEHEALLEWDRQNVGKLQYPETPSFGVHSSRAKNYTLYSRESVYYDDATRHIEDEMARHNRLVIVLQGILDRSPVFHPHPPWQLWTTDGFATALSLIYDDSRALTPGDAPDFEAYRARLNASLGVGYWTVGQEDFWEEQEAIKECRRLSNDYRNRTDYRPKRFKPWDDPGPGEVARIARWAPRAKTATFTWTKERRRETWKRGEVERSMTVPAAKLLNVSAYNLGDFKVFFADPRTRADYLQWAPLLLRAEDFVFAMGLKIKENA